MSQPLSTDGIASGRSARSAQRGQKTKEVEHIMPDDMFFTKDHRSLHRGKRKAARTDTCRPCLVWYRDNPAHKRRGVIMDVSTRGMRVRMLEIVPVGTSIVVQMMRDEEFSYPLSRPIEGRVARQEKREGGFVDHGVALTHKQVKTLQETPIRTSASRPAPGGQRPSRMHTIDYTIGEHPRRR